MSQTGMWRVDAEPADPVAYGRRLLDVAVRRHRPVAIFGLLSGGHDSLCATQLASELPGFTGALHIDTGIGIEETRDFVRKVCDARGWNLHIYTAESQGQYYDEIVREHGFPGPYGHRMMYTRLKERALRAAIRDYKVHVRDRIMLVTGVRRYESSRRMGTVDAISREGSRVWVAPLAWFTNRHKFAFMEEHRLSRNPVVDHLHMSGECLCGAFAKPRELEWLEFCGYTDIVARIRRLEADAKARGVPCRWGKRPPDSLDDQMSAPGMMCVGCANTSDPDDGPVKP